MLARHHLLRSHLDDPYSLIPLARYIAFFEQAAATLADPIMRADRDPMGTMLDEHIYFSREAASGGRGVGGGGCGCN